MSAVIYDDRVIVFNTIAQFYELNYPNLESCPKEIQAKINSLVVTAYSSNETTVKTTLAKILEAANSGHYDEDDPLPLINSKSHTTSMDENRQKYARTGEAIFENTKSHHLAFFELDSLRKVAPGEIFDQLPLKLIRSLYADQITLGHNAEAVIDFSEWFQSRLYDDKFLLRSMDYLLEIGAEFSQAWWNADYTKDFYLSSHYYSNQLLTYITTAEESLKAASKQSPYEIYHELSYALYDVLFALASEGLFPSKGKTEQLRQHVVTKALEMRDNESNLVGSLKA